MESIICLRGDQPLDEFPKEISATASLGATGVKLCCPKGDTCLLSNETQPEVLCYDPTDKIASSHSNTRKCDLQDGKCAEGSFAMSTEGVLTITSVVDGEGKTGDSESSGSKNSSSSSTSRCAALTVSGDTVGLLMQNFDLERVKINCRNGGKMNAGHSC
ncbi:hypothetical protein B0O99DRAFT_640975 [Bisporella sp. PMI_857]|nr:hypothetical protein B0O99DRAFT_640975 [Bisporella sp. PMI_857]